MEVFADALIPEHQDAVSNSKGLHKHWTDDEDASTAICSADDRSTVLGSADDHAESSIDNVSLVPAEVTEDLLESCGGKLEEHLCCVHLEAATAEDDEELDAREEAEFSLDARLATIKRWRSFRRQQEAACTGPPGLLHSARAADCAGPPGIASAATAAGLQLPAAAPPPGFSICGEWPSLHESAALLHIDAGRLLDTAPPWLEAQIRTLSQRSLDTDSWEALLHPEPDDPRWQLLAMVRRSGLIGFGTYAFFEEVSENGRLIMSVQHVVVASAHQGNGHGRRLLEELSAKAFSAGAWAVKLYSTCSAVGFYERLGFQVIGPNQLMEKRLL